MPYYLDLIRTYIYALCWVNMRKHLFIVQAQEIISRVKILQAKFHFL